MNFGPAEVQRSLRGDGSIVLFSLRDALSAWEIDTAPTVGVAVAGLVYLKAWRRLRRQRPGTVWPPAYPVAFGAGLLIILVAADGPPDVLSESSFSAHMVQHVLIQLVAAPLLLVGAPITLLLRADPRWLPRRTLVRLLRSSPARLVTHPLFALAMFAGFLLGSHLTPLYNLALERAWVHGLEHSAYLLTALLFWWPVIGTDRARRPSHPVRLLYLFLSMPVMAFLGVAITSSERVLNPYYAAHPPPWGTTALQDQQLAGVLMWESGMFTIVPALAVVLLGWLSQDAGDQARRDAAGGGRHTSPRDGTGTTVDPARRPPADSPGPTTMRRATAVLPRDQAPALPRAGQLRARVRSYVALTKPRIIELLLVTALPTMILADHGLPRVTLVAATLAGGALTAGAANTINCYFDRDIDAMMRRTSRRPLAVHQESRLVTPRQAVAFGVLLALLGTALLGFAVNWPAALLADTAIVFYVFVYTITLKRRTSSNIVIGGAAGCFPVLVGWAAVTGRVTLPAVLLASVVFFWTPPHFWSLAMRFREDYAAARVPMLPVVAAPVVVGRKIVVYTYATVAASLTLVPFAGWPYGACAILLGAWFLVEAHRLYAQIVLGQLVRPMKLFRASLSYLTLLFVAVAFGAVV